MNAAPTFAQLVPQRYEVFLAREVRGIAYYIVLPARPRRCARASRIGALAARVCEFSRVAPDEAYARAALGITPCKRSPDAARRTEHYDALAVRRQHALAATRVTRETSVDAQPGGEEGNEWHDPEWDGRFIV
jgi:hypothetical protein